MNSTLTEPHLGELTGPADQTDLTDVYDDDDACWDAPATTLSVDALDAAVADLAAGVAAGRWTENMARGSIAELVYASGIVAEEVRRYRTPPAARDDVTSTVLEKLTIRILTTTTAAAEDKDDTGAQPGTQADTQTDEATDITDAGNHPSSTDSSDCAGARPWFDLSRAQTSSTAGWVRASARNLTMTAVRSWRRQNAANGAHAGDDLLTLNVTYDFIPGSALAEAERRAMAVESFTATTTRLRGAANARLRAAQARELLGVAAPTRPGHLLQRRAAQLLVQQDPTAARSCLEQLQATGTTTPAVRDLAPVWEGYPDAEVLLEEDPAWCQVLAADAVADWPLPPAKDLKRLRGTLVAAGPGGKPARDLVATWVSAWVAVQCETTSAWARTPTATGTATTETVAPAKPTDPAQVQDVYDELCVLAGSWPGRPWGRNAAEADATMWAHAVAVLGSRIGVGTLR